MDDKDFDQLCRHLAAEIKKARKQAGISQESLALAADVDRTYVSQLERGIANPSLLILCRLAQALDKTIHVSLVASDLAGG